MNDLYQTCLALRSLITDIEAAIAFSQSIANVNGINNRIQLTETFLNQVSEAINPPAP
jgi:hypothetical protein